MFPLFALAALLSGGGLVANTIGARQADRAQADVLRAERNRRNDMLERSYALNEKSAQRYADVTPAREKATASLTDMFLADDKAPDLGLPSSDSTVTVSKERDAEDKGRAYTDQQAGAKAKLMSLTDVLGGVQRGVGRDAEAADQLNGSMQGSQGVLPAELDAAAQAGSGWRLAGDIAGGLGSVATMGALTGAELPGLASLFGTGGATPTAQTIGLSKVGGPRPRPADLVSLFG